MQIVVAIVPCQMYLIMLKVSGINNVLVLSMIRSSLVILWALATHLIDINNNNIILHYLYSNVPKCF